MHEPIKTIGYHTIDLKLGNGVTGKIKVVVVPKQA
jgi:ribosomal protein L9